MEYIKEALFNIYLEDFINQNKNKFRIDQIRTLWYKTYADDLVFVTKSMHLV